MRRIVIAGLRVGVALGGVASVVSLGQEVGAASGKRPMQFEDLQRIKRVSDPQISPGGRWVMFSAVDVHLEKNSKVGHLWVNPMDGKGAGGGAEKKRQLSPRREGGTGGAFSPDGTHIPLRPPVAAPTPQPHTP